LRVQSGRGLCADTPNAVDDSGRVIESVQDWMTPATSILLEAQIGVAHRAFNLPIESSAEHIREAKVVAAFAVFVVKRSFVCRHYSPAPLDKFAHLLALLV